MTRIPAKIDTRGHAFARIYPVTASEIRLRELLRGKLQIAVPGWPGKIDSSKPPAVCWRVQKYTFCGVFGFKMKPPVDGKIVKSSNENTYSLFPHNNITL